MVTLVLEFLALTHGNALRSPHTNWWPSMTADPKSLNTRNLMSLTRGEHAPDTLNELFTACQRELRSVAGNLMQGERRNHTLQPTALVNEVYLRLFNVEELPVAGRTHFVNIAARSMRRILVEHARQRNRQKRGGGRQAITLADVPVLETPNEIDLIELNDALDKLAELDPRAVETVELRIFGGLTMEEVASMVGVTRRTVQKDWRFAILWLRQEFTAASA